MLKLQFRQLLLFFWFSSFLIISFSGCAKYKPHALLEPTGNYIEKDNVKASTALLTDKDCKYYFSKEIIKAGFQPVQIYIENNSNERLVLDALNINLPIEQRNYVARFLHYNEAFVLIPGVTGSLIAACPLGLGAFLVGAYFIMGGSSAEAAIPLVVGSYLIIVGTALFLTVSFPFWVAWKKKVRANRKLDRDFADRILDKHSIIELMPHTVLNTVFFVKKENFDIYDNFALKLYNAEKNSYLNFDFDLNDLNSDKIIEKSAKNA